MKNAFFVFVFLSGCSSLEQTTALGFSTGIVGGYVARERMGGRNKSKAALKTGLLAGILGGIAGLLIHKKLEKRDSRIERDVLFNLENKLEVKIPGDILIKKGGEL